MRHSALITGATGFVGGHLVRELAAHGWRMRALVRSASNTAALESQGVELARGDLADESALRSACTGVDVVFHLAAVTGLRGDVDFERANVEGTRVLANALLAADPRPRRLIYLSSYAACGPMLDGQLRKITDEPAPLTTYGRTKLEGEEVLRRMVEPQVELVILRAPAVYGPGDHALLAYFRLVRWGIAPAPGGPDRPLHLVFAPDLAAALRRAADSPAGTYAVAEPVAHRWSEIVKEIGRAVGRRPVSIGLPPRLVRLVAAATEDGGRMIGYRPVFNREKAEEMLAPGWVCDLAGSEPLMPEGTATPLAAGVARTAEWYRSRGWL